MTSENAELAELANRHLWASSQVSAAASTA